MTCASQRIYAKSHAANAVHGAPTRKRDELRQELAKLDEQIAAQQAQEKKASVERLRALVAEEGLTLADLACEAKTPRSMTKALPTKGLKIPPKYRDPVTGQAWSAHYG